MRARVTVCARVSDSVCVRACVRARVCVYSILNYQPDATREGGYSSDCNLAEGMEVHDNTVATPGGSLLACGTFLHEWVAAGHDKGTKSVQWPKDEDLVAQGRQTLYSDSTWDGGVKL